MFNREFLKTTGLGLVSTAVSNPFLSEAQKPHAGRPNILLILVDALEAAPLRVSAGAVAFQAFIVHES